MSAIRSSSVRSLSKFSRQVRQLHITGSNTYSSPLLTSERPAAAAVARAQETMAKRPRVESGEASTSAPSRQFNTSRELKAVNDSSTIDFAYLPAFDPDMDVTAANIRMPIITGWSNYSEPQEPEVMRPEISTATEEDGHISAMSEVHDNGAVDIDFHGIAQQVLSGSSTQSTSNGEDGITKTIWDGLVEDILGDKNSSPRKH